MVRLPPPGCRAGGVVLSPLVAGQAFWEGRLPLGVARAGLSTNASRTPWGLHPCERGRFCFACG